MDKQFSRRHQTSAAHLAARANKEQWVQEQYLTSRERDQDAKTRTPIEQIVRLNARLGYGIGAKRERARLAIALGN